MAIQYNQSLPLLIPYYGNTLYDQKVISKNKMNIQIMMHFHGYG